MTQKDEDNIVIDINRVEEINLMDSEIYAQNLITIQKYLFQEYKFYEIIQGNQDEEINNLRNKINQLSNVDANLNQGAGNLNIYDKKKIISYFICSFTWSLLSNYGEQYNQLEFREKSNEIFRLTQEKQKSKETIVQMPQLLEELKIEKDLLLKKTQILQAYVDQYCEKEVIYEKKWQKYGQQKTDHQYATDTIKAFESKVEQDYNLAIYREKESKANELKINFSKKAKVIIPGCLLSIYVFLYYKFAYLPNKEIDS